MLKSILRCCCRLPQGSEKVDTAPGAPQERSLRDLSAYMTEIKELQRRYSRLLMADEDTGHSEQMFMLSSASD